MTPMKAILVKGDGKPYRFIRKINEGGYTKDVEIRF